MSFSASNPFTTTVTTSPAPVVRPLEHDSGNIEIRLAPAYNTSTVPIIPVGIIPLKIKPASISN